MGAKYTVMAFGAHDGDSHFRSYRCMHQGNALLRALWEVVKSRRQGFGCVTLEVRG